MSFIARLSAWEIQCIVNTTSHHISAILEEEGAEAPLASLEIPPKQRALLNQQCPTSNFEFIFSSPHDLKKRLKIIVQHQTFFILEGIYNNFRTAGTFCVAMPSAEETSPPLFRVIAFTLGLTHIKENSDDLQRNLLIQATKNPNPKESFNFNLGKA